MKTILTLLLVTLSTTTLFSQKETNNWVLGGTNYGEGITFNTPDGSPGYFKHFEKAIHFLGAAVISDSSGKLILYSDGLRIWNMDNKYLNPNTGGIDEHVGKIVQDYGTQGAIGFRKPGSGSIYYVFDIIGGSFDLFEHWENTHDLRYSIVDMSLNNGKGKIIEYNKLLHRMTAEKITAVKHFNGTDIWVITHDIGSNGFRCHLVTENGIENDPVLSYTGAFCRTYGDRVILKDDVWGYMKASPDGTKLAVAVRSKNMFQVFDFDNKTGKISKPVSIRGDKYEDAMFVEFSPDGTKLYGSCFRFYDTDKLFQFDLEAQYIQDSGVLIKEVVSIDGVACKNWGFCCFHAIQLAPDGKIYLTPSRKKYLSVIDNPNEKGKNCNFKFDGYVLSGLYVSTLPNFIQSYFYDIGLEATTEETICERDNIYLKSSITPKKNLPDYYWTGPNGFQSTESNPVIPNATLDMSGWYILIVETKGGAEFTDSVFVEVKPFPEPEIIADRELCEGNSTVLSTGIKYNTYLWNTGETTDSIIIFDGGSYFVKVTNEIGCTDSVSINIKVNPLPTPTITGETYCLGRESTYAIDSIPNGQIRWELIEGGEIIGNNQKDSVVIKWEKEGTWELIVQQTNVFGCIGYDTVYVDVEQTVFPEISMSNSSLCPGSSLTLSAPEGYIDYLWNTDETTREIEITKIGTNSVKVTDENGCIGTDSVEVTEADSIDVSIIGLLEICPGETTTLIANKDYAFYYWEETGDTTKSITISNAGTYTLTVENSEGCIGVDFVDVISIDAEIKFTNNDPVDFSKILLGFDSEITVKINNPSVYDIVYSARLKNNTEYITIQQVDNFIPGNSTNNLKLTFTPDYPQYYYDTLIIEATEPCEITIAKAITGAGYTTSKVWFPDTTAYPDTKDYCIPLSAVITNVKYISDLNLSYSAVINTDASLIIPTNKHSISGRDLQIKLNNSIVSLSNNTSIIGNICGWIIFADQDITPINITDFTWDNELVEVEKINGSVELEGVCARDLRRILGFKLTEMQISPNPADQSIRIKIESGEVGTFELSIYSTEGIEVETHKWHRTKSSPETNEINIDLTKISSGIYRIMLRSPMEIISQPLSVVK